MVTRSAAAWPTGRRPAATAPVKIKRPPQVTPLVSVSVKLSANSTRIGSQSARPVCAGKSARPVTLRALRHAVRTYNTPNTASPSRLNVACSGPACTASSAEIIGSTSGSQISQANATYLTGRPSPAATRRVAGASSVRIARAPPVVRPSTAAPPLANPTRVDSSSDKCHAQLLRLRSARHPPPASIVQLRGTRTGRRLRDPGAREPLQHRRPAAGDRGFDGAERVVYRGSTRSGSPPCEASSRLAAAQGG